MLYVLKEIAAILFHYSSLSLTCATTHPIIFFCFFRVARKIFFFSLSDYVFVVVADTTTIITIFTKTQLYGCVCVYVNLLEFSNNNKQFKRWQQQRVEREHGTR